MIPITALIGKGKTQCRMDQVDVTRVAEYAGEDADATWRIEADPGPQGAGRGALGPVRRAGAALDLGPGADGAAGVAVDVARLRQLSDEFAERMATIEAEIYQLAGRTFNINSARSSARCSSTS